jgi:hypothetical protein
MGFYRMFPAKGPEIFALHHRVLGKSLGQED